MSEKYVVHIRATEVHDLKNGVFAIELSGRPLSGDEEKLLDSLFPNTSHLVHQVLLKERLLQALASESEICSPIKAKSVNKVQPIS